MRRTMTIMGAMFLLSIYLALPAHARSRDGGPVRDKHTALGFHSTEAPLGVRLAVSRKYAVDLGVGFSSRDDFDSWAVDVGVPITIARLSQHRSRVLFRPGVLRKNQECPGGAIETTTLSAELEGEAFPVSNLSVSAAFGLAHESIDSPGADATSVRTTAGEYSRVGVHLYLWR